MIKKNNIDLYKPKTLRIIFNYLRSGAVSGIISTTVFTLIHQIFIADIWFSFLAMAAAGIICGVFIGFSYGLLFNVSILGLVYIPTGSFHFILELPALIITIITVYALVFILLERKNLSAVKEESIEY